MLKTPEKRWITAGIAACVLTALIGWFMVVGPQRSSAAAKWDEVTTAQLQTATLRARTTSLGTQFEQIDEREAELALKRQSLPFANDLEALVRALDAAAAATGVSIDAVTAAEPIDITPVPPAPVPTPGAPAAPAAPQPSPAPSAAAWPIFVLPVTIKASGSMADMERFLQAVQSGQPRAILFVSLTVTPGLGGSTFADPVVLIGETRVFVSPLATAAPAAVPTAG